ncbi:MAG: hypothetical protein AAGC71_03275 [Pseudomonadota bacterium]
MRDRMIESHQPSAGITCPTTVAVQQKLKLQRALGFGFLATASMAAWLGLAADAGALELGEASVTSTIGQPLALEIPYRLAPNERLSADCVSVVSSARGGLPAYTQMASIRTSNSTIAMRGIPRVLDPLIGLNVRIDCPTAPHIVRSYELFVNPATASFAAAPSEAPEPARQARPTAQSRPRPTTVSPRARGRVGADIAPGQTYTVVRGDTLSGIAARIDGRGVALWAAVDELYAQNPGAFERGDINRLREGAALTIPLFGQTPRVDTATAVSTSVPVNATIDAAEQASADSALTELAASLSTAPTALSELATAEPEQPVPASPRSDAPISESPFVEPTPTATASVASEPEILSYDSAQATSTSDAPSGGVDSWMFGVGGVGLGILVALAGAVFFGRRPRPRLAADPDASALPASELTVPSARVTPASRVQSEPAVDTSDDVFDLSAGYTADNEYTVDLPTSLADTASNAAPDIDDIDGRDPLAESSVDLDIGEALAATSIDVGTATAALDEPSTVTHVTPDLPSDPTADSASMTIAEMDALARDYEAEFTQTQELSRELAEAVADLKRQSGDGAQYVVPADETLLTNAHDVDGTAVLDDGDADDDNGWDSQTQEAAMQLSDEVLADDSILGPTVEQPAPATPEGDTVEMPGRASDDSDEDNADWPAYQEAAKRNSNG